MNPKGNNISPSTLDNAVIFFFAHQRLLFRYPLHNPFEVVTRGTSTPEKVGAPSSVSIGKPIPEDIAMDFMLSTSKPNLSAACSPSPSCQASPAASVDQRHMPTCVGLETGVLLFLLRNTFTRMTSLRVGIVTFVVCALPGTDGEALLVLALKIPDDSYGHVARYFQATVNALLREERRCSYVSHAVAAMMSEMDAASALSTNNAPACNLLSSTADALEGRHGKRSTGLFEMGSVGGVSSATGCTIPLSGIPELDLFSRAAQTPCLFHELRHICETVNGALHNDVLLHHMMLLPHSHLSGYIRHRRQVVASFSSRFPPGTVVTIRDKDFMHTRRKQYEHVLGREALDLLSLQDVADTLARLPSPWTLFAIRGSLEVMVCERMQQRVRSQREGGAGESGVHEWALSELDAPFLVFEVMEFLRLFGAITLHVQRIVFTHGCLADDSLRCLDDDSSNSRTTPSTCAASCLLGETCTICASAAFNTTSNRRTSGTVSESTATAVGFQQLLFDYYHSQYDDPWFSRAEATAHEEQLHDIRNGIPSIRIFEARYEWPHATLRSTSDTGRMLSTGAGLPSVVLPPMGGTEFQQTANPAASKQDLVVPMDSEDVDPAVTRWLQSHTSELDSRCKAVAAKALHSSMNDFVDLGAHCFVPPPTFEPLRRAVASFEAKELNSSVSERYRVSPAKSCRGEGYHNVVSLMPLAVVIELVVHIVVALLWGVPRGASIDDLVTTVDTVLRRVSPMLRNASVVMQRQDQIRRRVPDAAPLTEVEQQVIKTRSLLDALCMMQQLQPFFGRDLPRVSVKVLVHTAVNVIAEVFVTGLVAVQLASAAAV